MDKSCGRVADKFGLRTWTINLRTWIFGFTCLVFKTTCIDRRIPLREGAFFFTRIALFPPLDERNTRDKAKGLRITSEGYNRVNHFCLPSWVLLGNRMVCEAI